MTPDDDRRAAWSLVPWHLPIYPHLLDDPELAARLYAHGLRAVGDLDALVLAHREAELRSRCGLKPREAQQLLRRLLLWSKAQFDSYRTFRNS